MALAAGQMSFTLEFAKDLKDQDLFGRMDPYCVLTVAGQRFRTRTHTDGGKNPVWNQTFTFNVINENTANVEIFDSDTMGRDDRIGSCTVDFSKARTNGVDHQQVAVSTNKGKQRGFLSVKMVFQANGKPADAHAAGASAPAAPHPGYAPIPYPGPHHPPAYAAPPAGYYAAPPAPYPPPMPVAYAAAPPPPAYYAAPQPYYAGAPPPPMRLY